MPTAERREQRVLIFAPRGRDAKVIQGVVTVEDVVSEIVGSVDELVAEIERGAATAIVPEEALTDYAVLRLSTWRQTQEPWSDFPFVILLAKRPGIAPRHVKKTLKLLGNVVSLERPLNADTLATAAESSIRARRRQYEARALLGLKDAAVMELAVLNEHLEARVDQRTVALAQANDRLAAEILERERAQQAVIQAQRLEALGRLTGGVAHDFNNLLNVIQGNMDLIVMLGREESIKDRARTAQAACRRGAKLTSQLLTFARNQSLALRPIPVAMLFESVSELSRPLLNSGITIDAAVDSDVDCVLADASQMEMALLNIAINARDAMNGSGKISLRASLPSMSPEALPAGSYVLITIEDNGVGMAPEIAAQVFEPFFTTKGVGKGTGLGLSQVYGMAQQSGGFVSVRSILGKGTTVELWMVAAEAERSSRRPIELEGPSLRGLKILVVEDDPAVRASLVDALIAFGCEVGHASGGHEGLEALASGCPDLLLTDYLMPDMTGVEMAVQARKTFPDLPVLVATGYADMDSIEGAFGDQAVLRKPFQLSELRVAISRVMNLSLEPARPPAPSAQSAC